MIHANEPGETELSASKNTGTGAIPSGAHGQSPVDAGLGIIVLQPSFFMYHTIQDKNPQDKNQGHCDLHFHQDHKDWGEGG